MWALRKALAWDDWIGCRSGYTTGSSKGFNVDSAVLAAMTKWPNVPDCYGWLHLDAQGRWLMGELDGLQSPSIVAHEGLKGFMHRNYICPTESPHPGCWALQNGPQRVWVTLALAPLIVRLHAGISTAHTEQVVRITRVFLADDGVVYFSTDLGPAALESASMYAFSQGLTETAKGMVWQHTENAAPIAVESCAAAQIEARLGFKRSAIQSVPA
jgi:Protein of unknown function (DUF2946)